MMEHDLVSEFVDLLRSRSSPFGTLCIASEFYYSSGASDIVGHSKDGDLYVFEAKLEKWRKALDQAYRGTAFCDYAYVLIPKEKVAHAMRRVHEFEYRGVGICSIINKEIIVAQPATKNEPVLPWLRKRAVAYASGREHV